MHAIRNPFRTIEQDYDGESRLLLLGADRTGQLLEVVIRTWEEPQQVIHADRMRPKFWDYL